jgi:hypothetical protein
MGVTDHEIGSAVPASLLRRLGIRPIKLDMPRREQTHVTLGGFEVTVVAVAIMIHIDRVEHDDLLPEPFKSRTVAALLDVLNRLVP